jgi:hypothetical protein
VCVYPDVYTAVMSVGGAARFLVVLPDPRLVLHFLALRLHLAFVIIVRPSELDCVCIGCVNDDHG